MIFLDHLAFCLPSDHHVQVTVLTLSDGGHVFKLDSLFLGGELMVQRRSLMPKDLNLTPCFTGLTLKASLNMPCSA